MTENHGSPTVVAERLHLATGFHNTERDWVVERLGALGARLRSFDDSEVDLEINLKDRNGAAQQVTLECWIRRSPRLHLVATSSAAELATAINEVRTELIRQVDEAKTRREPRHNRELRHSHTALDIEQPET